MILEPEDKLPLNYRDKQGILNQAKEWTLASNKSMIIDPKDEKDLENQYKDYLGMKKYDRRQSDWKSMELFGTNNIDRYNTMKSEFVKRTVKTVDVEKHIESDKVVKEEVEDDRVDYNMISYTNSDIEHAKDYTNQTMEVIIVPRSSLEDLDRDWYNFNNMTYKQRKRSNDKSVELFGINNKTHYDYLKSKLLKADIDDINIDEYDPDVKSSYIEALCKKINSTTNNITKIKLCLEASSIKDRTYSENILIQSTLNDNIECFKDNICHVTDYGVYNDLPFYTPSELASFGVFDGENNRFSATPDNDTVGDITTKQWFESYSLLMSGGLNYKQTEMNIAWIDKLNELYYDYDIIKQQGNQNKINARMQSILELGWNPYINFNVENRLKANNRVKSIIEKCHEGTQIIDISKYIENYSEKEINDIIFEADNDKDIHPMFIVFLHSNSIFNDVVTKVTKGKYGHVALGFNPSLDKLYGYSASKGGFNVESIKTYRDVIGIKVFCVFINKSILNKLMRNIRYLLSNKEETGYSFINLLTIPLRIDYKSNLNMVCSQFVDSMLKLADMNFTNMASSMISPKDIYSKLIRNRKVYKVYEGSITKYNPKKISGYINDIINIILHPIKEYNGVVKESVLIEAISDNIGDISKLNYIMENQDIKNNKEVISIYERMIKPYIEVDVLREAKEFPVQFDDEGNLLIDRMNSIDFDIEYNKSHKLLLSYENTENLDGIKYELSKLWFMNQLIEKKIYDNKINKEKREKLVKSRARILNDFNRYINFISSKDNSFNFNKYYEQTQFNDTKIKINHHTLKYTIEYVKRILLP